LCVSDFDVGDTQQIVVEEQSLSLCIEDIHKVQYSDRYFIQIMLILVTMV